MPRIKNNRAAVRKTTSYLLQPQLISTAGVVEGRFSLFVKLYLCLSLLFAQAVSPEFA